MATNTHINRKNFGVVVGLSTFRKGIGCFIDKQSALLSSKDGIDWQPTPFPKVVPQRLKLANGTMADDKLERPCLYTEKGVPKLLFGALGFEKRKYSVNVAVPLK